MVSNKLNTVRIPCTIEVSKSTGVELAEMPSPVKLENYIFFESWKDVQGCHIILL